MIKRLVVGWMIALLGGVMGSFLSFHLDLPSGAAIVCTFGVLLLFATGFGSLRSGA